MYTYKNIGSTVSEGGRRGGRFVHTWRKRALMTQEIKIVQEKLHGFWVGLRGREEEG